MTTEKTLQAKIVKIANAHGTLCYKFNSPSNRGVPDLIMIPPTGLVYFIEVKHPNGKGKLSKLQEHTIKKMTAQRTVIYVIANEETAIEVIARHSQ